MRVAAAARGRPAEQYIVQAIDENRHGVVAYSRVVLSGCLRSANTEEIAQQVDQLVQQRVRRQVKPSMGATAGKDGPVVIPSSQTSGGVRPVLRLRSSRRRATNLPRSGAPENTHWNRLSGE